MSVKGRDLVYGLPKTIVLEEDEIRNALADSVNNIVRAVRVALERTPPELAGDISERGIILTGGGSLLKNLDKRIRFETGTPVLVANDPLVSVVLGTGKMLENFELLRKMSLKARQGSLAVSS
jgi:rod shape-determining protein MreB